MADELPVTPTPPDPGAASLLKLVGVVGGVGCCLPIVLITGFCLFMLVLASIMRGCN
jgi:hypothetical protein